MPETRRVLWQNKFWIFDASIWLFYTKLITMNGHLNINYLRINKFLLQIYPPGSQLLFITLCTSIVAYPLLKCLVSSVIYLPGRRKQQLATMRWLIGGAQLYISSDLDTLISICSSAARSTWSLTHVTDYDRLYGRSEGEREGVFKQRS